jgi:hypothetical protein
MRRAGRTCAGTRAEDVGDGEHRGDDADGADRPQEVLGGRPPSSDGRNLARDAPAASGRRGAGSRYFTRIR